MTADTPAASKDAPTDEAVMVNIAGNAQDLERAKEHARLLLKRVAAGPVGDGLSHAEYALLCLYAHVAALTTQLEAERASADSEERAKLSERTAHSTAVERLKKIAADNHAMATRETARADKAEADAKALKSKIAVGEVQISGQSGAAVWLPWEVIEDARATLAQPADGGK